MESLPCSAVRGTRDFRVLLHATSRTVHGPLHIRRQGKGTLTLLSTAIRKVSTSAGHGKVCEHQDADRRNRRQMDLDMKWSHSLRKGMNRAVFKLPPKLGR